MQFTSRGTWLVALGAFGLVVGGFIALVFLRAGFPPSPLPPVLELIIAFTALTALLGFAVGKAVCRHYQRLLRALGEQVVLVRQYPATHRAQALPSALGPLQQQLESLSGSYRQALADLVEAQQALALLRSLPVRADAEKGHSHSFIHRGAAAEENVLRRMIARLTPSLHWMTATPGLQLFVGSTLNDLVARSFLERVHPEDAAVLARLFQDVLRDGEGHNIVFRIRARGGSERHVQMDVLARYNDAGEPLHLRCHFLDISDRVRTEQELRHRTDELYQANVRLRKINSDLERLKESYRDLYHQAPAMYFSLDGNGRFAAFNETLTRSLGYGRQDLFDQPYTRVLAPASQAHYLNDPSVYQGAGEVETQWLKRDGSVIDVWIRTTPILDADGKFIRSRSGAQDVTERNRLALALQAKAEELEQANVQLRRINQELDQFTYVVSHDLKEPLRTVQAFSTFLRQDYGQQLGAEGHEYINHLLQASQRLGSLIDDLLTLSRAGRALNMPRAFSLTDALATACGDLRHLLRRTGARVRVEGTLPAVVGDPERVVQLLTNLVTNGLKYNHSEQPEIVVGARSAELGARGERAGDPSSTLRASNLFVTVFVRDNGIGIAPEFHEQVFGIFRRLHHREEYEGTGAGLAICKKIVESHGGRIWVESLAGAGATFFFTLPRAPENEELMDRRDVGKTEESIDSSSILPSAHQPVSS